jgi:lipopolysaccharide/colanic/teichoic acid biosynthesis glycosyltransferase
MSATHRPPPLQDLLAPSSIASFANPSRVWSGTLSFCLGGLVLKRAIDILAASVLLIIALPMLAFASVLIRFDSPGPAIFCQARMGRRFRCFQLYKLRTMTNGGDGPAYTLGADPRITPIGYWLRRFKIDELPQLWNVLRGDMSIVGPRPVIPELAMEFEAAYQRLLTVRPGLTDPASLKYCRETEILSQAANPWVYFKTVATPDKIRISQQYLERANSWTDMVVVGKTVIAMAMMLFPLRLGRPKPEQAVPTAIPFPRTMNGSTARAGLLRPAVVVRFAPPAITQESKLPSAVRSSDSMQM